MRFVLARVKPSVLHAHFGVVGCEMIQIARDAGIPLVTSLYGDGGQGKSLLAVHLASAVALGRPFLGLPTEARPVLYLDAELDADEFTRRAYGVARGMGESRPPAGLHYLALEWADGEPLAEAAGGVGAEIENWYACKAGSLSVTRSSFSL